MEKLRDHLSMQVGKRKVSKPQHDKTTLQILRSGKTLQRKFLLPLEDVSCQETTDSLSCGL